MLCTLHVDELAVIRHGDNHPVAIHITHGARKRKVFDLWRTWRTRLTSKESHRPSKLKIMLYVVVVILSEHLHHKLVQRVIIALPHLQRIPCITTLNLPLQPHLLGLFAESFLLRLILQLEQ